MSNQTQRKLQATLAEKLGSKQRVKNITFTIDDIADYVGIDDKEIRKEVRKGKFDPKIISSVFDYIASKKLI